MLNDKEKEFIVFWEANRLRQKRFIKYLQYGLPAGVILGAGILASLGSGWYKRATMVINAEPSLILVLLVGLVMVIVFVAVFAVSHRWDINEQHYRELQAKRKRQNE